MDRRRLRRVDRRLGVGLAVARVTSHGADKSMPGMEMPGAGMTSPSDVAAYMTSTFVMWLLMMVAMMLPSAAPMILFYGGLARGARAKGAVFAPTSIFAAMYLAVWAVFSALATFAQWLLVRSGAVSEMTLAFGDRRIGGFLLVAAGLYQATPLKRACLDACRSPLAFLLQFLAARLGGRGASRPLARNDLSGLLRSAHGAAVCVRRDKSRLGRRASADRSG